MDVTSFIRFAVYRLVGLGRLVGLIGVTLIVGLAAIGFGSTKAEAQSTMPSGSNMSIRWGPREQTIRSKFHMCGCDVRVRNDGSVYLARVDGMTEYDATDTHFKKVKGLSDSNCVSFESIKYPGHFLRHSNDQIKLQARDWWFSYRFNDAATFCPKTQAGKIYYESFNKKHYYIGNFDSALVLSSNAPEASGSVSWTAEDLEKMGFLETPLATLHVNPYVFGCNTDPVIPSPSCYMDGEFRVWQGAGECTGLASWWGTPPTKTIGLYAYYNYSTQTRLIKSSATGTSYTGYYPWIKLYMLSEDGYRDVSKIKTGSSPCVW